METSDRSRLKQILGIAAPIVLGQISHVLVGLADTLMVSDVGSGPLAALGLATPVFLVAFLVFSSVFQGTQILCARRLGEGKLSSCGAILSSALLLAVFIGIVAANIGWWCSHLVVDLMTDDPQTAEIAADYLRYRWGGGMFFIAIAFAFRGFYWGIGLTRTDLVVSLFFNLTNICFNWVLIYGNLGAPALGAAGAGLGSALANVLSVSLFVVLSLRPTMRKTYRSFVDRPGRDLCRRILSLSWPRAIQALAFTQTVVFFGIISDHCGRPGLASSAVIWRFIGFTVLVSIGIGSATATLVGRELGRGRPDSAASFGWTAVKLGLIVVGVLALLFAVFREPILGVFFDHQRSVEDPGLSRSEMVALASAPFLLMLLFQVVDAVGIILSRSLNGAGEVRFVMCAEILVAWAVCIPATLLLVHLNPDHPLLAAWSGWAAYCTVWALVMSLRWHQGRWKSIEV